MALNKRTYIDEQTLITAQNLNEIQDAIIASEGNITNLTPLTGATDPTTATAGAVKQLYLNTTDNTLFMCTAATGGTYTWVQVGGGEVTWGTITGTLSAQTDLQNALNAKVPTSRKVNGHALTSDVTITDTEIAHGSSTVGASLDSAFTQIANLNTNKADKTALALTDRNLKHLAELTKGQAWDTEAGTTPAYQHIVASGAKAVAIDMIGGKTEVVSGALVSANVTDATSKDSDNTVLGTYTIPQALRTAYPLKSAGSVYDEYDIENKKFIQRVGTVDLGSLSWTRDSGAGVFAATLSDAKPVAYNSIVGNLLCAIYSADSATNVYGSASTYDQCIAVNKIKTIMVSNSNYSDAASFKTAMNGVMLQYELATPIEVDISSYLTEDNVLTVEAGGTLTFTQSNSQTVNIPIPNDTVYAINLSEAT